MRGLALAWPLAGAVIPASAQAAAPDARVPTPKADANGDGVADDLAREIAPKAPDERVPVIVTLKKSARTAASRRVPRSWA